MQEWWTGVLKENEVYLDIKLLQLLDGFLSSSLIIPLVAFLNKPPLVFPVLFLVFSQHAEALFFELIMFLILMQDCFLSFCVFFDWFIGIKKFKTGLLSFLNEQSGTNSVTFLLNFFLEKNEQA